MECHLKDDMAPILVSPPEICRTAALGTHLERCDRCSYETVAYDSCRNRHFPKCQSSARDRWLFKQASSLLLVPYAHVVFTVPEQPFKADGYIRYMVGDTRLFFTQAVDHASPYNKENVGLNHIALGVRTIEELHRVESQLNEGSVAHSGIKLWQDGLGLLNRFLQK
jgi:hypothetical protein